jgi:molybdenum cofactor guanylyltransferase
VYEPSSHARLVAYVAAGRDCPRKFLLSANVELLEEPNPRALDNANTPEEYAAAMSALDPGTRPASRKLNVQYYALLREQAGRRDEALVSGALTAHELYAELARRYRFSLAPGALRVAINGEFADWSTPLADGDAVVFIPPVAGG